MQDSKLIWTKPELELLKVEETLSGYPATYEQAVDGINATQGNS